jgi:prevent-host-death family protein
MKTATIREAQHHLSKLMVQVEQGEEIVLTRRGKPVGRLVGMEKGDEKPKVVCWADSVRMRNEALHDLPQTRRNPVLEMREEERY